MQENEYAFSFKIYDNINELETADQQLLKAAIGATAHAYAPYSGFYVGAAARLKNGEVVEGSNQENASFPVGICAERVVLAAIASSFSNVPVESLAVSYQTAITKSDHPIAPCGMCRQALQEYETRMKQPIKLILGGLEGKVYVIPNVTSLLPFSFTSNALNINVPSL